MAELEGFCRRGGARRCTGSVTAASRGASPERIEEKREPGRGVRGLWRGRGARREFGRGLGGAAATACSPRRQQPAWREEEDGPIPGPGGLAGPPSPRRQVGISEFFSYFFSVFFCNLFNLAK